MWRIIRGKTIFDFCRFAVFHRQIRGVYRDNFKMLSKHKMEHLISAFKRHPAIEATAPISNTSFSIYEGTFGKNGQNPEILKS